MEKVRQTRVWNSVAYRAAASELSQVCTTKRLNKQICSNSWILDKIGRIVRRRPPHQILLPMDPISDSKGEFLPGLELGATDRIRRTHTEMLHAGAYKVHQHLTKEMNYSIPRRAVEQALVNQCDVCMRQQVRRVATPAVPVRAFWPMQRVQLDFIDCRGKHAMFPRKMQHGNWDNGTKSRTEYEVNYILVMVCVFSGFAWFRPVHNNSQWEVCFEITKWANDFGWPQIIHTDNGTPFNTRMLTSLVRDHDTFLVHGRPYHPQSQGKVERLIGTLKNMIRKMQEDKKLFPAQPWLQYLARAVFVYNRTPHAKTGVAPFVAFFGRRPLEDLNFRGEWEMNSVEHESHDIVTASKRYHPHDEETEGAYDALTEYVTQLATPDEQDTADRNALCKYLVEQQPKLLAQITALQDRKNSEMVRRSMRRHGELKPVHIGDRVVFSKMAGLTVGMSTNPLRNLLVGTVIDAHLGGVMQTYTVQEDSKSIHQRVPRENIGIRIAGYTVTDAMKTSAAENISAQAQTFALRLGRTLGIETPESCIDPQPGFKGDTFAQVPFRDPIPTLLGEEQRTQPGGQRINPILARPVLKAPGSDRHKFEQDDFLGVHPQTTVTIAIPAHMFAGGSCPGCTCNDCDVTLGGKQGKYCVSCYKEAGFTFCQACHAKWQAQQ